MPKRCTESKKAFDGNVQRARYFLEIHEEAQKGRGSPSNRYRELPRAALVFAVGAIDAYLAEVTAEVLVSKLHRSVPEGEPESPPRQLLNLLAKEIPGLALETVLMPDTSRRLAHVQRTVADHFHNKVTSHGAEAVGRAIERMGGRAVDLWSALKKSGGERPQVRLNRWTERRHKIVHQGQRPQVRRDDAKRFIDFTTELVERLDERAVQLKAP